MVDGIHAESPHIDQTPRATPRQPVKDGNKENFTPEAEKSDEWTGLPWTPADVSSDCPTFKILTCVRLPAHSTLW